MPDHPAYRGAQSTPYPRHVPELDPDYLNDEIRQRLQPELAPGQYGPSDPPRVRRRRRAASPPRPPNPLPHPPRNLFQGSPYLTVLQALHRPIDDNVLKASITSIPAIHTVHTIPPQARARPARESSVGACSVRSALG
ncbi:hypothetical protein A0H81_09601 [Grifola frondosa]|uniref:Uncharacterized protein n=1 Tax=Grifola frondosa TaxID=5627 RepID=A0A1C7M0R0_GRIFR|nr:hypothetical protein A0H81_09601 [Grifola frondosa]